MNKTTQNNLTTKEPIALVGIGCKFPGNVNGPSQFWDALKNGENGISEVPSDRWDIKSYYNPDPNRAGKIKSFKGGFIDDIKEFDAEFYGIYPKEADRIDPQQRLLLQASFEAMEDAGAKLEDMKGSKTSVFMGVFMNDYWDIQASSEQKDKISAHVPMGVSLTSIANRLSYVYDLKGPSVTLDTACSSSLVGVHLACNSIWNGEAEQALAGGVNLILRPESSIMMSKGNFLCPDGYCKPFSSKANGYVRSEGAGVVLLMPLSKAIENGYNIYATIKGSAVNSDGYTEDGFTVPSPDSQAVMLNDACEAAGVSPLDVQYVEAHGTGTPVGDPIETKAFSMVFGKERAKNDPLIIGSVKSNIGHLEAAAGIAGLIKASLCVKNKQIPQILHFDNPNPNIPFSDYNLKVADRLLDFPHQDKKLLVGVNSFGAGGTNAHVVLEEFIPEVKDSNTLNNIKDVSIFSISGQTAQALNANILQYIDFIESSELSLEEICKSTLKHRSNLNHKFAASVRNKTELIDALNAYLEGENRPGIIAQQEVSDFIPKVGFIYSGQGPQWFAMGRQLIENDEKFKNIILKIESYFSEIANWSLLEEMLKSEEDSKISDTRIAQPAIMAIQIALTELWKRNGIMPEGVVGHSIGEVAAAYASGSLTLKQAVQVIYHRSRGQNKASGKGKMLAVGKDLEFCLEAIKGHEDRVSIGAINGPEMITLSGDTEPLEEIAAKLDKQDIFHRFLRVTVPFHSHHMEELKDELIDSLSDLIPAKATLPLYSTVTGKLENGKHLISEYWYANVREAVYFSQALEEMIKDGFNTFIEIAPHPVLAAGAEQLLNKMDKKGVLLPSIRRKEDEAVIFNRSLAHLSQLGVTLDLEKIFPNVKTTIDLPKYAWQKQTYWFETREHEDQRIGRRQHPYLKREIKSSVHANNLTWEVELDKEVHPFIEDHKVDGVIIFPGTGHLEIARAAAEASFGEKFAFLENVNFESALFLPDEGDIPHIRLEVSSEEGKYWITTQEKNAADKNVWTKHSNGKINYIGDEFNRNYAELNDIKGRVRYRKPITPMYKELKSGGLYYGDTFKAVTGLWTADGEVLSEVSLHNSLDYGIEQYGIHPAILDACLHTIFAAKQSTEEEKRGIYLPVHIDRFKMFDQPGTKKVWSYVKVKEASNDYLKGDYIIFNDEGQIIAEIQGLDCKYIQGSRGESKYDAYKGCYEYEWIQSSGLEEMEASENKHVLIFGDNLSKSDSLRNELSSKGAKVSSILDINSAESIDRHIKFVDFSNDEAIKEALGQIINAQKIDQIIILPSLDAGFDENMAALDLDSQQSKMSMKVISILKVISEQNITPKTWILSTGNEIVTGEETEINLPLAGLYGIGRVMINEYPQVPVQIVDMPQSIEEEDWLALTDTLFWKNNKIKEKEFAIRNGELFFRRLNPVNGETVEMELGAKNVSSTGNPYRAEVQDKGILDSMRMREFKPQTIEANDVEIEVKAVGLNFKDVMNSMSMLEDEAVEGGVAGKTLGLECSGIVKTVGENVTEFKSGDEVIAWTAHGLAGLTTTSKHCVVKKPENISFKEAASLTVVFLTAHYSLNYLGRMRKGDRVLIHAASGGVGIAAIQLAQLVGAEVYATAGSEEKREFVRNMGVKFVYDSRSLHFYDNIMKDTNGEGVDIVLNSLPGKYLTQSMRCLRSFGRFIEIGKADIYDDAMLSLKKFGQNISFHAVDLDRLMLQRPQLGQDLYLEIASMFANGELKPHPIKSFPMSKASEALQYLTKVQHIGKVVISNENDQVEMLPTNQIHFDSEFTYVVTGGASGFGLELAKWLVDEGARNLVLISRSGAKSDYDKEVIANMEQLGAKISLPKVDITDEQAIADLFQNLPNEGFPQVKGIIHSAAVLADSTIANLTEERFKQVFNPKVLGAWNLHKASEGQPLDFFLMLSSISSVFGLPGQANYSAANNFLDKLAIYRQQKGLAGNSVNIGVLGNYAGMSRDGGNVLNVLSNQGWVILTLKQIKEKIAKIILQNKSVRMAANIDWKRFREFFIHLNNDARFAHLMNSDAQKDGGSSATLKDQLLSDVEKSNDILIEKLTEALAKVLGTSPEKIDPATPISNLGLDSLMLNQLRNWILQKVEVNYPLMKIAKGPSLVDLSADLIQSLNEESDEESESTSIDPANNLSDDVEMVNDWLLHVKNDNSEAAELRVFTFHPVGAGASMFGQFMLEAPENTDFYSFQLPGRENRGEEKPYSDMQELIPDMAEVILPLLDRPFAFFGHSFGGIVAFELIRYLRKHHGKHPVHLFCSGTIAPQLTGTWKNRDVISQTAIRSVSEERLFNLMSYIDDEDFVRQILPVMRNDMPLIMSYPYQAEEPLTCPITVFSAEEDEVVLALEMAKWEAQTNAEFRQEIVHGDHWFLSRNKDFVIQVLTEELNKTFSMEALA
ncbi:SDR family NAD(P)-dependent oxidoreductase [Aureibacter tunicatorum]|uniref:Polyketide synthase 12 n=1 Tax=Aureibacter tunicatorum TaxID=866807 RepID=A0AAE4BUG5_9BACT|nr:SDR family NAD(P)-dependent oxidoreductase [Aureibacter tunicatorum]MDR6240732.1 polyketide synthase 12 [Aureibacter tunicatorum]BDD06935.1 polyketide synthase [Aureibacter tunicatorum]